MLKMREQELQRASLSPVVDKSSALLMEAAVRLLAGLGRLVGSTSDPLMISLRLCCIDPVGKSLSSANLEARLRILSALGSAAASTEIYGICLEPIIKAIGSNEAAGNSIIPYRTFDK